MKHTYLTAFLGLALFAPAGASAQAGGEEPAEPPADSGGTVDGAAVDGAAVDGDGQGRAPGADVTSEETAPGEQAGAAQPEGSTTAEGESDEGGGLGEPTVAEDLAAAEEEVAEEHGHGGSSAAGEAAGAPEDEPYTWRNSLFISDHQFSTATFDRSAGLTYNPTYAMTFSLQPRWYLNDAISLRARWDLTYEPTDSDSRALNRELVVGDLRLEIADARLFVIEGIVGQLNLRMYLPTSKASRAYDMYVRPGLSFTAFRAVPGVLDGLILGVNSTWSYRIGGSNVVFAEDALPQVVATPGLDRTPGDSQVGGSSRVGNDLTASIFATLIPLAKMTVDFSFTWWWQQGVGLADACVGVLSSPAGEACIPDGSDTHLRLATWFTLGASYDFQEWFNLAVTYGHLTSELSPNGRRRNPFWSIDSTVSLTATLTLDSLYDAISGAGQEETPHWEQQYVQGGGSGHGPGSRPEPTAGAARTGAL